ncbi:MAG: peptidylprolyl isomerase [Gammaproteobacteria bacterium]|nr:peptidylprolyl isomerase [Gammaproteobacteria bacterium]
MDRLNPISARVTLMWLLACLAGPVAAAGFELDRIIAIVDDDVVMQSELDQQIDRVRDELRRQGTEAPPLNVLRRQVMERLVLQKIQLQLAEKTGVNVTEDALDRAIDDIAQKNKLSAEQFREILASEGYDYAVFREDIRHEIILARLRREEVDKRLQVSEREIDNYLLNEQGGAGTGEEFDVAHILISIPAGATDDERRAARERAEEAKRRLDADENFDSVAVAMSDGQDALDGGALGWRKLSEIPTLFSDVVRTFDVDETSGIITSPSGYHIVKLKGKRSGETVMLEQTKVRHILISPGELLNDKEALARLQQLRLRLENGDDFAQIARTNSDDRGSALQGGDLGWVSPGQMVPQFEEVMNETPLGELSPPFRSEFGWHVLQVLDKRQYDGTDEVKRAKAREAVMERKREEAHRDWLRRLRDEAYVELRIDSE